MMQWIRRAAICFLVVFVLATIASPMINVNGESPWMRYRLADDRTRPLFFNPCASDMITIAVTDGTYRCLSRYPLREQPGTALAPK